MASLQHYILFLLVLLTGPATAGAEQVLRYGGATTLQKAYMPEAGSVFGNRHGIGFDIQGGNTGPGLELLRQGALDIAGAGRFLNDAEKQAGLEETLVGWDVLIPIVHLDNSREDLSLAQLRGIFNGSVDNWQALGGPNLPIALYTAPPGSGIRMAQQELILHGDNFTARERTTRIPALAIAHISNNPAGIGVISKAQLMSQAQGRTKALSLGGVKPSAKSLADGSYPLVKPLTLVTRGEPEGPAKQFIEFTLSDEGQRIMHRYFSAVTEFNAEGP